MGRRTEAAELQSNVRAARTARGLSQQHLAGLAGLTRQTIVAIETGRYTPNTAVALRLAQALACRVEDLFLLPERLVQRRAALAGGRCDTGARVVVANVGDRLVAHQLKGDRLFAPADGVALNSAPDVRLFITPEQAERTAFLVGCDPSLGMLATWVSRRAGDARLVWLPGSSQAALDALRHSTAHVAGIHLRDPKTGEFNVPQARRALAKGGGLVVSYAGWEQGFIVQRGNPKKLGSVDCLARPGVRLVNREPGSGSRTLLDQLLGGACIRPETIAGYDRVVSSHMAVARAVADGAADLGIGLRAVASSAGVDFVPLADARFDFLIPSEHLDHPAIRVLLDVMQSASLRAELSALPGYSVSETGTARVRVGVGVGTVA
jgi:molybdate-binding protein/DNA-binding XRE family transcriptional regulator